MDASPTSPRHSRESGNPDAIAANGGARGKSALGSRLRGNDGLERPELYWSDEEWAANGYPLPARNANYCVKAVAVAGPLTLKVEPQDGVTGLVRFEPSHLRGVFKPLRNPAFFASVFVEGGAVRWPGDLDLAPDNMHRHLFACGEWVLA